MIDLKLYFNGHTGSGVLATADGRGVVNTAIYARPHVLEDSTVAFIMRDRLSRKNLLENGYAGYLFRENGEGHQGLRLHLKLLQESTDHELLKQPSRSPGNGRGHAVEETRYLVTFSVEKCLALIGDKEFEIA